MLDYMRIACAVPAVKVADVMKNAEDICKYIRQLDEKNCDVVVFPELALTGYTCQDLFFQESLLQAVKAGTGMILQCSAEHPAMTVAFGLPVQVGDQLYNCCAVVSGGMLRGIVPKTFVPNYNEFSEKRWFSSACDLQDTVVDAACLGADKTYDVAIGADLQFVIGDAVMAAEICEDLWSPLSPSTIQAISGAEVLLNLSASNEAAAKRSYRRELVKHQSAKSTSVYAYCGAGCTESTQDLVFSGYSLISADGVVLGEQEDPIATDYALIRDVDLGTIRVDRRRMKTFGEAGALYGQPMRRVDCEIETLRSDGSLLPVIKMPFVPRDAQECVDRCMEIFNIQVAGLKRRLQLLGANAVLGISGGLDSTLAVLVAVEAMRQLGRPATDVHALTLPCFGTSDRTYRNALELMKLLGVTAKEINIKEAVSGHFKDIGHDISVHNATYENAQARERTQILMDYAGMVGGIVVGTGDLSELALGWCTYNGDHMSMYSVNGSVPKTLIPYMIRAISQRDGFSVAKAVLEDIVDTPISPELLPPDEKGQISQQTEDIVGPYALHDFFLYYMMRFGYAPKKIYLLACRAFAGEYDSETIKKWLVNFYRRFFSQQFKRNCMPDGVRVGSVGVSPRGDWRMPSDASAALWLQEAENV